MTLIEHASSVNFCVYAPNGKKFVTASDDCTAVVWDANSGKKLRTLFLPSKVLTCAISSNGFYLLTNFHLWELSSGKLVHIFEGDEKMACAGEFSNDNTLVATGGQKGMLHVWNLHSKKLIYSIPTTENIALSSVGKILFSSDSKYIVSGATELRFFDANSANTLFKYPVTCRSSAIAYNNGFAIAGFLGSLIVFEIPTGNKLHEFSDLGGVVESCAITPDSRKIVASVNKSIHVWDAISGQRVQTWDAHEQKVQKILVAPENLFILSISGTSAKAWDFEGNLLYDLTKGQTGKVSSCTISPSGSSIITASQDGVVRVWDVPSVIAASTSSTPLPPSPQVTLCKVSPNGKWMLTGSEKSCNLRNTISHSIVHSLPHSAIVNGGDFIDNHTAITHDAEGNLRTWNVESGALLHTFDSKVFLYKISPKSEFVIIIDASGHVQSRMPDSKLLWELPNDELEKARSLVISPTNLIFAVASNNFGIFVRSTKDGSLLRELTGHSDLVESMVFSPRDEMLISASHDGSVRIWRVSDGSQIHSIQAEHKKYVISLTMSPCGKHLLTSDLSGKFNVWDCSDWTVKSSFSIGLANFICWISSDRVALHTATALAIYNINSKKFAGSWFYKNLGDAVIDYAAKTFVVGTNLGEIFSLTL
eukprot:Phypoly_transcript_04580.p1 GENE.Phypoly_transcript_04580~~Phypoly_transcript_04580.p1  ORF type:complete len:706 (+),score=74.26 Phypoly_transcript_04580:174-2120(+)